MPFNSLDFSVGDVLSFTDVCGVIFLLVGVLVAWLGLPHRLRLI